MCKNIRPKNIAAGTRFETSSGRRVMGMKNLLRHRRAPAVAILGIVIIAGLFARAMAQEPNSPPTPTPAAGVPVAVPVPPPASPPSAAPADPKLPDPLALPGGPTSTTPLPPKVDQALLPDLPMADTQQLPDAIVPPVNLDPVNPQL